MGSGSLDAKVTRSVITDAKALSFKLEEASFAGAHSKPRIWFDKLEILGQDMGKFLFAIDGGQNINDVTSPTAAANLIEFHLAGPQMKASLEMTIGVPINPKLKTTLETLLSSVKKSEAKDTTIKFGDANKKQEYKNNEEWDIIVDLSDLVLKPIDNSSFNIDFKRYGFLGGSTAEADYYILQITGVMIDKKNFTKKALDIVHGESTEKGQYSLLSIDDAAANAG